MNIPQAITARMHELEDEINLIEAEAQQKTALLLRELDGLDFAVRAFTEAPAKSENWGSAPVVARSPSIEAGELAAPVVTAAPRMKEPVLQAIVDYGPISAASLRKMGFERYGLAGVLGVLSRQGLARRVAIGKGSPWEAVR